MSGLGRFRTTACCAVVAFVLTGCTVSLGGAKTPAAPTSSSTPAVVNLSKETLRDVLLGPEQFHDPGEFRVVSYDARYGIECLDRIDLDGHDPHTVENTTAAGAHALMGRIRSRIGRCVGVRKVEGDFVYREDVSFAREVFGPNELDEQVNVVANGVFGDAGNGPGSIHLPATTRIAVMRLGNLVAITGLNAIENDKQASSESESLARMVLARLRATSTSSPIPELSPLLLHIAQPEDVLQYIE
jgi:hypothetical protein